MDRRDFLQTAAAGLAVTSGRAPAADRKPRVAVVGCGWFGMFNLENLMDVADVEVVGLCDPNRKHLEQSADWCVRRGQKKPELYKDYRELVKPGALDILINGTPDHWHCLPTIEACAAGIDVYVEKPISVCVAEGRAMVNAARKHNRVVQVGLQRRSTRHIAEARDFVRGGGIGDVHSVEAYCYYHMGGGRKEDNPPDADPPGHLDYDLWTGPAPMRPFNPLIESRMWRRFTEYGNGILGDMGVHMLDVARWVTGARSPKRVTANGGILVNKGRKPNVPDFQKVVYDFGDLTMTWEHRSWGRHDPKNPWGVDFIGPKGTVKVNLDRWELWEPHKSEPTRVADVERDGPKVDSNNIRPANRRHMKDFLAAIAGRGRPVADIEEGHLSTVMCCLGNVALQVGRQIQWDADTEIAVGDEAATKLLKREYRGPWKFPLA